MLKKFLKPKYKVDLIRFGNKFDGGYLVPRNVIKKTKVLLSFGLNDDWSFEKDFSRYNKNCSILCFDHSVNRKFWYQYTIISFFYFIKNFKDFKKIFKYFEYKSFFSKKNIKHHIKKLVAKIRNDKKEISLKELGKIYFKDKVFIKMDIDNDEWRLLSDLKYFKNIIGMVIELHNIDINEKILEKFLNNFKKFKIVHIHPNNMGGIDEKNNPLVVEVTLLNKRFINKKRLIKNTFKPHHLDYINDPLRKDIKLSFSK